MKAPRNFTFARTTMLIASLACFVSSGCIDFRQSVVSPADYLKGQTSVKAIYSDAFNAANFVAPFDVSFAPMHRLMLLDFDGDPTYRAVELQTVPGNDGKEAAIVLLYRHDKTVDQYWTANFEMSEAERRSRTALLTKTTFGGAVPIEYRFIVTVKGARCGPSHAR